jgi:hypothetical protein
MSFDKNRWIYHCDSKNLNRYTLGEKGKKPLVVFGINPSTAKPDELDPTLEKIEKLSKKHNYDGWIMFNIYPQRATDPDDMDESLNTLIHKANLDYIEKIIKEYSVKEFIAAWGNLIDKRDYLKICLQDIYNVCSKNDVSWRAFKVNKTGHPKHPLYINVDTSTLVDYDIKSQYKLTPHSTL